MIIQREHYGVETSGKQEFIGQHRKACMCFADCKHFVPDDQLHHCEIAKKLFAICKEHNVTTPVYECATWEHKDG